MSKIPSTENIITELENGWLTIWFNRVEKRNALSKELIMDLFQILDEVHDDRSVRGIIFRGKGGTFCAGADLKVFQEIINAGDNARELATDASHLVGKLFQTISTCPQITVSAVEGAAMAGGFGIACTTDLLVTMANARYALTETRIGLTPAQIAPYVINRLGFAQARKLMLLGTSFNGQKAFEIGMADYVSQTEDEFSEFLANIKEQVRKCAPNAVALTKNILSENHDIDTIRAAKYFSDCIVHSEGKEGFTSFFEKREPDWISEN